MQTRLAQIKLLALDVDGVLTDGTINIGNNGELFKGFNAKDGLGLSCALRSCLYVAIITGRKSEIIHKRAAELGISLLCEGVKDKYSELVRLARELQLTQEEIAYMGDDLYDLPAFKAAGIAFAPQDAVTEVAAMATIVTTKCGGRGAVREAVENILKAQNKWEALVATYLESGQGDKQ